MNRKKGKWAEQVLTQQRDDGTWGHEFHSLSFHTKQKPLTTEQALRRLHVLGFTIDDEPIRKAVSYMTACLCGERKMDNSWEKTHNWPLFTKLMLSAWIRVFEPSNDLALCFAYRWADVIGKAFACGKYDHRDYVDAYTNQFAIIPKGAREVDFASFYHMTLLKGVMSSEIESMMLDYILSKHNGIYYVYSGFLNTPPSEFTSKQASRYLAGLEILAEYSLAKDKLGFVVDWLISNRDMNNQWDFGMNAIDNVHFPLADSWRNPDDRLADCTERVEALLYKVRGS